MGNVVINDSNGNVVVTGSNSSSTISINGVTYVDGKETTRKADLEAKIKWQEREKEKIEESIKELKEQLESL